MTVEAHVDTLFVLRPGDVPLDHQDAVLDGAAVAPAEVGTIGMSGPAVVDCLQGSLTSDVGARGSNGLVYGAVLTPKGMIISDLWVARDGTDTFVFPPTHGKDAVLDVFKRFVPPRMARYHDRSDRYAVLRLAGPEVPDRARQAGLGVPEPGETLHDEFDGTWYLAARPATDGPFALQLVTEPNGQRKLLAVLEAAGVVPVTANALELARILSGWPRLGVEIDHKTLPQEVRYDEIDAVSYTKGCFTGQETVARVHFRGRPNRWLGGVVWNEEPDLTTPTIVRQEKNVGHLTSVTWLDRWPQWIALAKIRREVERGERLTAAGRAARVVALPFEL